MAKGAVIVNEPRREDGRLSARVSTPHGDTELWFSVADAEVSPYADAFLVATLLPAMRCGVPLRVDAPVSPKVLEATDEIQRIFHGWNRRFRKVAVEAPVREGAGTAERGSTACFFTCGVDSFFSVLRRLDELDELVYGTPFDLSIAGTGQNAELEESVRIAARELGKPLLVIETNLRSIWAPWLSWEYFHGAAIMSLALSLSPRFARVYVPPSVKQGVLVPWGSRPDLDPLWGTEEMEFLHVDNDASRFERVALVSESKLALRHMQLCWQPREGKYNCCRCEKCLRAMMTLHILGRLDDCPAFSLPLTPEAVAAVRIPSKHVRGMNLDNLRALEAKGQDEELVRALRKALRRRPLWSARRSLDRRRRALPVG